MDYRCIQSEKAKAMMRYRRLRNVAKMWQLLEFLVAVLLLSWSSTRLPLALKFASRFVLQHYDYLFNTHITFVIGNAIIIVVVLISRQNNAGNNASAGETEDQLVQIIETHHRIASASDGLTTIPQPVSETEETACEDKQIVLSENAVTEIQCDAVSTAIEEATKQIRRFERTQSVKLKRELRGKPSSQLRRSETVVKSRAITASGDDGAISSFEMVDTLSNEEFRRKVEAAIAEHQRFLWAQKMAEIDQ